MKNNSKILMIGPDPDSFGGISSVIKLYQGSFDDVMFLSSCKNGNIICKILFFGYFLLKYLLILFKNKSLRIIHIHVSTGASFFRKSIVVNIAKLLNKKVIFNIHPARFNEFYENSHPLIKTHIKNILDKSDLILILSEKIKIDLMNICPDGNFKVLYNPITIKELKIKTSKDIKALFLGKLCRNKGVYDIIEAAKQVKSDNIKIYLYGDGDYKHFQKLIESNNLQDKMFISGWISGDKKEKIIETSDIFVLPSYTEGLPISILEAMVNGLPIVATPVGGIPEAVIDRVNGFLIEPGNYNALADKIELLANNKELRNKMGQESFNIAKEKFDISVIVNQLKGIYEELLG
ncbi:MAG: hypothetical protein A2104_04775 [Candidatus Melainabacteria bacterium GWF2_32_7]|nr:MAG: hypothetical protein A2104_04775 [Candidatus Melainabacteria bacterium GWF2_32_7]